MAALVGSGLVLLVFAADTFQADPKAFWTMIFLVVLALGIDAVRKWTHTPPAPRAGTAA